MANINKANSLNGTFSTQSSGVNSSCRNSNQVAIFPVRYAIDEAPQQKGTPQGPHPIPTDWVWPANKKENVLPNLTTRSYCLRQLRDGWLYVYDSTDEELHEYKIQGKDFIFKSVYEKTSKQTNKKANTKTNPDRPAIEQTREFLFYSSYKKLYLNYSPVRCTDRIKEQLTQATAFTKWTRYLSLPLCEDAHSKPIHQLGKYLADITPASGLADSNDAPFTSTTVTTVTRPNATADDEYSVKPVINELAIRVPMEREYAVGYFVALDDPLGIIDDLTMNLIGRWGEYTVFDKENQHKANIAQECLKLTIGDELINFIPKAIRNNPEQYYDCIKDINQLLEQQYQNYEPQPNRISDGSPYDRAHLNKLKALKAQYRAFTIKWGYAVELYEGNEILTKYPNNDEYPNTICKTWQTQYRKWNQDELKLARDDLRLNEMLDFMTQYHKDKNRLENHIDRHQPDLVVWLNKLDSQIESLFHDPADKEQLRLMAETTEAITSYLSLTSKGKQWLREQFNDHQTFLGLANFGFSKEIYQFIQDRIKQIEALNEQQLANQTKQQNKTSTAGEIPKRTNILQAIDNNNLINRMGELQSVLSLDIVKNHAQFKALSKPIQQIFDNLCILAGNTADQILARIASYIIPALNESKILAYQAISVVTNLMPDGKKIYLSRNQYFKQEMADWLADIEAIKKQIATLTDKNAIEMAKQNLNKLEANPPSKWFIEVEGNSKTIPALSYRQLYNKLIARTNNSVTISELKAWTGKHQGSALPLIVTLANIANLYSIRDKLRTEGYSKQWQIEFTSASGYAVNSAMAMWVMPMVENYKLLEGLARISETETKIARLTEMAINKWSAKEISLIASAKHLSNSFAAMSLIGALAAGLEAWSIYHYDLNDATAEDERFWIKTKFYAVGAMATSMAVQGTLAFLARFFAFGWFATAPFFTIVGLIAGAIYLLASTYAKYYKRNSLRLWLHRCTWGKEANTYWATKEDGYLQELHALYKVKLQPTVIASTITGVSVIDTDRTVLTTHGIWLGIILPEKLEGETIQIEALLVHNKTPLAKGDKNFYQQLKNHSYWSALPAAGQPLKLPTTPLKTIQPDYAYKSTDNARLLLTWIDTKGIKSPATKVNEIPKNMYIELKFTYKDSAFFYEHQTTMDKTYLLSLELEHQTNNSQIKIVTDYYHQKDTVAKLQLGNTVPNNIPQSFWVPTTYSEIKGKTNV